MRDQAGAGPLAAGGRKWIAPAVCGAMLLAFAILSYSAALTKNATYDEPLHAVGGYVRRTTGDFRINPEDPALFGYWASLPHGASSLQVDYTSPHWKEMLDDFDANQWALCIDTLYHTPANNAERFIQRSRLMFVLVGIALGATIGWWAWRLGGAWAALIATAFFALDPNFLAHSSLIKNDVMTALTMLGMALAVWHFGRAGTWKALAAIAGICAVAVNLKFSAVLFGPMVLLMLLARAWIPMPWTAMNRSMNSVRSRLLVAPLACIVIAVSCYASIWAVYRFRFSPTDDPSARLSTDDVITFIKASKAFAQLNRNYNIPPEVEDAQTPGKLCAVVLWAQSHHLLPQAWLHGFLYTYATTIAKPVFLLGKTAYHGTWIYFPLAMLFKTPTATILAGVLALCVLSLMLRRPAIARSIKLKKSSPPVEAKARGRLEPETAWILVCFAVPIGVYFLSALTSGMNIGVRHMLPLYPFLFIAIGAGLARLIALRGNGGRVATAVMLLGLAIESLGTYPNFIAFFNTPSGGPVGGIALLGDSNLDWGQDLKLLAQWRTQHRAPRLYFAYFGSADPAYYGIDATPMPGSRADNAVLPPEDEDCYVAISATYLQGLYLTPDVQELYTSLHDQCDPIAILGGSIYVYKFPPQLRENR